MHCRSLQLEMCGARKPFRQRFLQVLVSVAFLAAHCGLQVHGQDITATAGQPATFLCEATGAGFESATFAWFYEENMIIGDSATYTINAVQVTNAGVYTCVVRVGAVEKGRSNATLHVQIPNPTIEINQVPFRAAQYTGIGMMLQCEVDLPDQLFGVTAEISIEGPASLDTSERVEVSTVTETTPGRSYTRSVTFSTLSHDDDRGDYTCNATVLPLTTAALVRNGIGSISTPLVVTVPTLVLSISPPSPSRILDTAPHNQFNLTCQATTQVPGISSSITLHKSIIWYRISESGLRINVPASNPIGGVIHRVTSRELDEATSTSVITVTGNLAGLYDYMCKAILDVSPATDVIQHNTSTSIIVHGGSAPNAPTNIRVTDVTSSSVAINWDVPFVQYTPETYTIRYNTSTGSGESTAVDGNENITLTDQSYSQQLVSLEPFTTYQFMIKATASGGTTSSENRIFTTAESVSSPPQQLDYTVTAADTFVFTWSEPASHNGILLSYLFLCAPLIDGLPPRLPQQLDSGVTNTTASGLFSGVQYECSVRARNSVGDSDPTSVLVMTQESEPAGPPLNLTARPLSGGRKVTFSWAPPEIALRNGLLTGYLLSCSSLNEVVGFAAEEEGSAMVVGLEPRKEYSCSLSAENGEGSGPVASVNFTTLEDSVYFQLRWDLHESCTTWVNEARQEKIEAVTAAIVTGVSTGCQQDTCGLTPSFITDTLFQCYTESSRRVTFRATLHGTPESTSAELLALLEEWVASGVSISILSVRSNIDPECSVRISSVDESECFSPSTGLSTTYVIIIGAVAGVLVLMITLVLITLLVLVAKTKKRRRRKKRYTINFSRAKELESSSSECRSTRSESHPLPPLPISRLADNPLYEQVNHEYEDLSKYVFMASAVNPYVIDEGLPCNQAEDMTSERHHPVHVANLEPFDQSVEQGHVMSGGAHCRGAAAAELSRHHLNSSGENPETLVYDQAMNDSHVTFDVHNPSLGNGHVTSGDTVFEEVAARSSGMYDHPFDLGGPAASSKNSSHAGVVTTAFASAVSESSVPPAVDLKSHPSIESETTHEYINTSSTCDEVFEMSGVYSST